MEMLFDGERGPRRVGGGRRESGTMEGLSGVVVGGSRGGCESR